MAKGATAWATANGDRMTDKPTGAPTFAEACGLWLQIGLTSIGGPAAQISLLHDSLVTRRRWIAEPDFETALNFCMLLPGPEAQQLAAYLGWRLHGVRGAVAAGGLFVLPGACVMAALSWLAASRADAAWLKGAFAAMLPVVATLIGLALWRMGRRSLRTRLAAAIALGAFLGLVWLQIPFPLILAIAAVIGLAAPSAVAAPRRSEHPVSPTHDARSQLPRSGTLRGTARLTGIFGLLWLAPVAVVVGLCGRAPYLDVAAFFTQAAFVTFGGAYAVLPFVGSAAVDHFHWLSRLDMLHGLALAETTPGPLILTNQYVGFFAGWNAALAGHAGGLPPLAAGAVTAALSTWMTFLPCFYFVLAGAPAVERLSRHARIRSALAGVTCAVIGVIASLGLLVAREALWPKSHPDPVAMGLAIAAAAALLWARVPAVAVIAAAALTGAARGALA